jgi:2-polyprenyl-6-methoxyphenol hydroxylase-like FAD-dependent oxidoreductase
MTIDALRSAYDVVVVGGRCAGAATALLLARAGAQVLLVDQGARGSDTLSTLALMRAGVLQLSRWGLLDAIAAAGTPRIETTTFHYGAQSIEIRIKPRDGVDALYAPRRTVLDPLLADTARSCGADVAFRVRLKALRRDAGGRVAGVVLEGGGAARSIAATIVVGADGLNSTVATQAGAQAYRIGRHMSGVIYTLARGLNVAGYHWHYVPGSSVGLIPTNDAETLVFAASTHDRFMQRMRFDLAGGFHEILRETAPRVAASMRDAALGTYRAFAGRRGFVRPAYGRGWALVGDAGCFKDPITAHGITDALRDAELLARAVAIGSDAALAGYQAARDALTLPLFAISDEIASFAWDLPRLQALHKSLSDEMAREVLHLTGGRRDVFRAIGQGTTAMTSISSISSGRTRPFTSTNVLAGVASPK